MKNKYSGIILDIARRLEWESKQGGAHSAEYHRIAQHLKKSSGHLRALEIQEGGDTDAVCV